MVEAVGTQKTVADDSQFYQDILENDDELDFEDEQSISKQCK